MKKSEPLALTDQQIMRLTTMINSIDGWAVDKWYSDYANTQVWIKFDNDTIESFHWFEFVMLHLAPKLLPKWPTVASVSIMITWTNKKSHPVNTLYKIFKKDLQS